MVSFYRPTKKEKSFVRKSILLINTCFKVKFHGYKADDALVEIKRGEHNIRTEDVLAKINEVGDELALVLIGGVNYYTGQVLI
jgi:kynureninase